MSALPARIGGDLAVDFVNTVDPRHSADRDDYLATYGDLLRWAEHAGIVRADESKTLREIARQRPNAARVTVRRARSLREALYQLLSPSKAGRDESARALAVVNDELARAMPYARLRVANRRFEWTWAERDRLETVLWPVVRAATALLTSQRLQLVRECESEDGCGWLFVDTSKNKRRRWCDMRTCGNRAKSRRYRRQHRTDQETTAP